MAYLDKGMVDQQLATQVVTSEFDIKGRLSLTGLFKVLRIPIDAWFELNYKRKCGPLNHTSSDS